MQNNGRGAQAAIKVAEVKLDKALTRIRELEQKLESFATIMKKYEQANKHLEK